MTQPGVGTLTAVAFVLISGEACRFDCGKQIAAYLGLLRDVRIVLVVDWPSRDIPETLARAGFDVIVRCGPGIDDYSIYESDRFQFPFS